MKNIKNGFTLIELLVVISIIGILAALLMSNFAAIRERARDAQRKSDLKQIQKALEFYKDAQTPAIQYPQTSSWETLTTNLEGSNYMKKVPVDPINANSYVYSYAPTVGDTLNYTLKACLENASDKDGANDASCPGPQKKFELSAP